MSEKFHRVTVVVAAKNEAKYVSEALSSILSQQGVDLELIFVDDGSTDQTMAIAIDFSIKDDRIKVYANPAKGKCSAFNFGVAKSSGDYICIFAGDDIMPEGSLLARLEAVAAYGQSDPVIGLSKLITMSEIKKFDGFLIPRAKGVGTLSGVSPLMNRKSIDLVFPVPEILPNEDTWMELAALHLHEILLIHSDVVACMWRVHSGNSINMMVPFTVYNSKITPRMKALALFFEKFKSRLNAEQSAILMAKIRCEECRVRGDVFGVMMSGASLVHRLRSLSITNGMFFSIRKTFYGLFSGW